jgi:MFS family permease
MPPPVLDVWGFFWLSPGIAGLFYGVALLGAPGSPGGLTVIVPLAVGVVGCLGYVVHTVRASRVPLIDLGLLRIRSFSAAILVQFLFGFALFGSLLVLPLFYQNARHDTALVAGLLLAPQGIGALAGRWWVGPRIDWLGVRNWVVLGILATALGTLAFAQIGVHTPAALLFGSLVLRGAGLSTLVIAVSVGVYHDVPPQAVPSASSMSEILQQLGGSLVAEVLAIILAQALHAQPMQATVTAYGHTMWWSMAFLAVMLIPVPWLPRRARSA